MDAARDVFYRLYRNRGRSDLVDAVLKQLEFHPLSVTLLATVAQQNRWSMERLVKEWERRRTDTLQTEHRMNLGSTIELSLASPMFKVLGPDARGLLGVVAFYPQGVDEDNIDRLFPTVPNRTHIFDKFCIFSLTYRSNGFITMLAPLRDHLCPKDPMSSPLLCMTKEHYFTCISVRLNPKLPGSEDPQWIMSEDVNVEHMLNVFISVNPDSDDIWNACTGFIIHLTWHKPRQTVLRKKIEGLPDDHWSKIRCLFELASLYGVIGNDTEKASLLNYALKLGRERGNDSWVAHALGLLSQANRSLGHYKEGIDQVMEALEIYERLGQTVERAGCLNYLAGLLEGDGQLDAEEEAVAESIKLLPEKGGECQLYSSHFTLGQIYRVKGEKEKAIYHYELALGFASTLDWNPLSIAIHSALATLFLDEDAFDDAQFHVDSLASALILQARIWYKQHRFEDAASEALRAQDICGKLGDSSCLDTCKALLQNIELRSDGKRPPL